MRRRGTSEVLANWLLNTDTSTMIGMALTATASGLTMSLSSRKRISRKLIRVPSSSPTRALVPDTLVAPQMSVKLSTNACQIFDGAGRKYGFQSNNLTAASQAATNSTPNAIGGQATRTMRRNEVTE